MLATASEVRKYLAKTKTLKTPVDVRSELYRLTATGADPVNGMEFVFTSHTSTDVITRNYNLPDPNWHPDQRGLDRGLRRGDYKYYDGWPADLGPERPYVVRFSRPETRPGFPSEWTQGNPIKIYGGTS